MLSVQKILAKNIMARDVIQVESGEHLSRVAKILIEKNIHNVAVFDNGVYAGLFGYKQLLRLNRRDLESAKMKPGVKNFVSNPPKITPETNLVDIADLMYRFNAKVLPVFSGEKLSGVVSERDVVRALADAGDLSKRSAGEVMTPGPKTVSKDDVLGHAVSMMREHNLSRLPVTDKDGKVVGVLESINLMRLMISKGEYGKHAELMGAKEGGVVSTSASYVSEEIAGSDIPVHSLMQENPVLSRADEPLTKKISELGKRPEASTIIVVDEHNHPTGIISSKDIIQHIAALKPREVQYIQISGLEAIEGIDDFQKAEVHKAIDSAVKKIAKSENIHSFDMHFKAYHTTGNKSKYVIRARVKTDKSFFAVKNWGWDPIDVCIKLMHEVERAVLGEASRRRDVVRRRMHDSKESAG